MHAAADAYANQTASGPHTRPQAPRCHATLEFRPGNAGQRCTCATIHKVESWLRSGGDSRQQRVSELFRSREVCFSQKQQSCARLVLREAVASRGSKPTNDWEPSRSAPQLHTASALYPAKLGVGAKR